MTTIVWTLAAILALHTSVIFADGTKNAVGGIQNATTKDSSNIITAVRANEIADAILDEIFNERHKPVFEEIKEARIGNKLKYLGEIKDSLISQEKAILNELEKKKEAVNGRFSEKEQMAIVRKKNRLKNLQSLEPTVYLDKFQDIIQGAKSTDTVAIRVGHDGVYVAGDVTTRSLPFSIVSSKMFLSIADETMSFEYVDFGLHDVDSWAVERALAKYEEMTGKEGYILTSANDRETSHRKEYEEMKQSWLNQLKRKLNEAATLYPTGTPTLDSEVKKATEDFLKGIGRLETYGVAYNSEKRLRAVEMNATANTSTVLGVSKSLCMVWVASVGPRCEQLSLPNKGANHSDNMKPDVTILKLSDMKNRAVRAKVDYGSTRKQSLLQSLGCHKNDTLLETSCSFIIREEDGILEIDVKKFLEDFRISSQQRKENISTMLGNFVGNINFSGELDDVNKAATILEHHKMKSHDAGQKTVTDAVNSGNFDYEVLKTARISPRIAAIYLSKSMQPYNDVAPKFKFPPAKLLARTVVEGFSNIDTTGLPVISAAPMGDQRQGAIPSTKIAIIERNGLHVVEKTISEIGIAVISTIAKQASPLGATVVGAYSGWVIGNAATRYVNPDSTKEDQLNEIDAIGSQIITRVIIKAAMLYPPAAPLTIAAGIVATLVFSAYINHLKEEEALRGKGKRQIDHLQSKLALSKEELDREYNKIIRGMGPSIVFETIIKAKEENNNIVAMFLKTLESAPDISGVFIPSRSVPKTARCKLYYNWCPRGFRDPNTLCEHDDDSYEKIEASECYQDGSCQKGNTKRRCENTPNYEIGKTYIWFGWSKWRCVCPQPDAGELGGNSLVDLRQLQNLYLDRCSPDPPASAAYEYTCVPSSSKYVDNLAFEKSSRSGYLCQNAIGIQRKRNVGNYTLFNLGDGSDTIYANDGTRRSNRFYVGDGRKEIIGGPADDSFIFSGSCQDLGASLDGGAGDNIMAIGPECRGKEMDFANNPLLSVKNIQTFYGRKDQGDKVTLPCGFEYIYGLGGAKDDWDSITLKRDIGCTHPSTIIAASYTIVTVDVHQSAQSGIVIPEGATGVRVSQGYPTNGRSTVLLQYPSYSLASLDVSSDVYTVHGVRGSNIQLIGGNSFDVLLQEKGGEISSLLLDGNQSSCVHSLNQTKNAFRKGCQHISNIFMVFSVSGNIEGGTKDDVFNVTLPFNGHIFGGDGNNVLALNKGDATVSSITINLNNTTLDANITATRIHEYRGLDGIPETVILGCETSLVLTGGGTSLSPDVIVINLETCQLPISPTIHLHPYTLVQNNMTEGVFRYIIHDMEETELRTLPSETSLHEYIFLQELDILTALSQNDGKLNLTFRNGKTMAFSLGGINKTSGEYMTPKIRIRSSSGDVMALTLFLDSPQIIASFYIKSAFEHLLAFPGVPSYIVIATGNTSNFGNVTGNTGDDTFVLKSFLSLTSLDGGGGNDEVVIHKDFLPFENITLDLRGQGTLFTSGNVTRIFKITGVERLIGRGTVYPSCNTESLKGFQQVAFSLNQCPSPHVVNIYVDEDTEVEFQDLQVKVDGHILGTYNYIFQTPRSFQLSVNMWMDIRATKQVYHLTLNSNDLEEAFCAKEKGKLYLITSNGTYNYAYDNHYEEFQQFQTNPEFVLQDGYVIQIDRYGEILFSAKDQGWEEYDDDTLAQTYGAVTDKLEITSIIRENGTRFIYAGNYASTNVLTSTNQKSLLLGGGGNKTTYMILYLKEDVKIYPGFREEDNGTAIHTLDLTNIIFPIRNVSEVTAKYVPAVHETRDGHINITMDGHRDMFPATLVLVNGTKYAHQIQILLESVAMCISRNGVLGEKGGISKWKMEPLPFIVDEMDVTVLSLKDLEVGQQIIMVDAMGNNSSILNDSQPFKSYKNGDAVIVSNLGSTGMEGVKSLVISDMLAAGTAGVSRKIAETLKVVVQSEEDAEPALDLNITTVLEKPPGEWVSALARVEEAMIADVPEIPRAYGNKDMTHLYWKIGTGTAAGVILVSLLTAFMAHLAWKRRGGFQVTMLNKRMGAGDGEESNGGEVILCRYMAKPREQE